MYVIIGYLDPCGNIQKIGASCICMSAWAGHSFRGLTSLLSTASYNKIPTWWHSWRAQLWAVGFQVSLRLHKYTNNAYVGPYLEVQS